MNNFYWNMEKTVRPFIEKLRNNGINTTCSCEHDGYIQATSTDPTTEKDIIYTVMYEMGVEEWSAELIIECASYGYFSNWEIKSPNFIKRD